MRTISIRTIAVAVLAVSPSALISAQRPAVLDRVEAVPVVLRSGDLVTGGRLARDIAILLPDNWSRRPTTDLPLQPPVIADTLFRSFARRAAFDSSVRAFFGDPQLDVISIAADSTRSAFDRVIAVANGRTRIGRVFIPDSPAQSPEILVNEILLTVRAIDELRSERARVLERTRGLGVTGVAQIRGNHFSYLLRTRDPVAALAAATALRDSGWVAVIDVNTVWPVAATRSAGSRPAPRLPDDTFRTAGERLLRWHLEAIDAPAAWTVARSIYAPLIAVIDDGFDIFGPDLAPRIEVNSRELLGRPNEDDDSDLWIDNVAGWNAAFDVPNVAFGPDPGHGQAVAGLALADSSGNQLTDSLFPVVGVCFRCRLLPIVRSRDLAETVEGVNFAVAMNADVIVGSWFNEGTGMPQRASFDSALSKAFHQGRNGKGILLFFAVGNDGGSGLRYPASSAFVFAVGASDCQGKIWSYSQRAKPGVQTPAAFLVAPAGPRDIDDPRCAMESTAIRGRRTARFGGTSSATPIAAGVAALALSVAPELSAVEMIAVMKQAAKKLNNVGGDKQGAGQVSACRAVYIARNFKSLMGGSPVDWPCQ